MLKNAKTYLVTLHDFYQFGTDMNHTAALVVGSTVIFILTSMLFVYFLIKYENLTHFILAGVRHIEYPWTPCPII